MPLLRALGEAAHVDTRWRRARQTRIPPTRISSPFLRLLKALVPRAYIVIVFFASAHDTIHSKLWLYVHATCTLARPSSDAGSQQQTGCCAGCSVLFSARLLSWLHRTGHDSWCRTSSRAVCRVRCRVRDREKFPRRSLLGWLFLGNFVRLLDMRSGLESRRAFPQVAGVASPSRRTGCNFARSPTSALLRSRYRVVRSAVGEKLAARFGVSHLVAGSATELPALLKQ